MTSLRLSSFRPSVSISRLSAYIRLLFHIKASLEGTGSSSHTPNTPDQADQAIPEFDRSSPTDPAVLCNLLDELTRNLQSRLPGCELLEEGVIEFIGDRPIDAGQVANVFVGMKGNRKVAIKCYRFYQCSDYLPAYMVRIFCDLKYVLPTETLSVEIPHRGIGLRPLQESELRAVHRHLLHPPTSDVHRLRVHGTFEPQGVFTEEQGCRKA